MYKTIGFKHNVQVILGLPTLDTKGDLRRIQCKHSIRIWKLIYIIIIINVYSAASTEQKTLINIDHYLGRR